jgi:single-stranded DNA-binding protein
MSLTVLAQGVLVADPQRRSGKTEFATCAMRVATDDGPVLVNMIAFAPEAVAALLALSKGDSLAVTGKAKLTSWTRDGEEKHGLGVVAEQVLTLYQAGKRRERARTVKGGAVSEADGADGDSPNSPAYDAYDYARAARG